MSPERDWDFEAEALGHLDSVYRVAVWLCGDPTEAQDLTQDTYERAFRARGGFVRTNMRAWLLTILRHRFLNVRRRHDIAAEVPLPEPETLTASPLPDLPPGLVRGDIERALAKLPLELRVPVLLADVEELGMAEIAEVLGWPLGTVKSRLWRARAQLGALLEDYGHR
ncbi:MAG: RNA polymerase sigma factor [Candidatus Rokubacteria bacterium]|nr:RNA polymerase sigma factor [Candidatus Rokubacteria bacterium]